MVFTAGQSVNVNVNGVQKSGKILRVNPLGSKDAYVVKFDDNSQVAYFGAKVSQISAA